MSQVGFDHDLEEVMTSMSFNPADKGENRPAMERFLDDVGWAALLITVGALWLVPAVQLPHGTWMIAIGVILLVLNVARMHGCGLLKLLSPNQMSHVLGTRR